MGVEADSGLLYPIFFGCVLLITAFFIYKLFLKVKELSDKIEDITQQMEVKTPKDPVKEETPSLEELETTETKDPSSSNDPN